MGVAQGEAEESEPQEPPCPICRGTGFVRRDVSRNHPDFGKAFPCECKSVEFAGLRRQRLERLSNLGPLTRLTFDTLIADGRNPETADHRHRFRLALAAARDCTVASCRWPGSFADARNAALELARGRFVLSIDADEQLEALLLRRQDGPSVEMDDADFARMREQLRARIDPPSGKRP